MGPDARHFSTSFFGVASGRAWRSMEAPLQVPGRDPDPCLARLAEQFKARQRAKVDWFEAAVKGQCLLDCPSEPPWQVERPSWAEDATEAQGVQIRRWLAWFYGLKDSPNRPSVPLARPYCFRVAAPRFEVAVDSTSARMTWLPTATAEFQDIEACAQRLAEWRREECTVSLQVHGAKGEGVPLQCWQRPEFITLALSRVQSARGPSTQLSRGVRGDSNLAGQFGVIPIDIDLAGGIHAERDDGLRLPEPHEVDSLLEASGLPWGYQMPSAGGLYAYLKLSEPVVFADDPIRAVEIIQGAQQRVIDEARKRGIHVDLAYTSANSLCRVPHTYQSKYLGRSST